MAGEIVVPSLGESVTEATVAKWFKKIGDAVAADEPLVELETDKVTMEVNAPASGSLKEIKIPEGKTVNVGTLLGNIAVGAAGAKSTAPAAKPAAAAPAPAKAAPAAASAPQSGPAVRKILAKTAA
jgi:2-oxoglutarate dehydrogenase E2 component (dihydrolipoamide succinyltransferase)